MKANPGGIIAPENVFGRDELISIVWDRLDQQCVLINAERRIGKTSMMNKMVSNPPDKWFPVYHDLEGVHSAEDFAKEVYGIVQTFLAKWKKSANLAERFFEEYKFGEVSKTSKKPWKALLTSAIEDLSEQQKSIDKILVMFWDEVPYMVGNILRTDGEQVAAEVLDTLRSLRHKHPQLRMVYTGSIGLHHILKRIKEAEIASQPVNDMCGIKVPVLDAISAKTLARSLIEGEELSTTDIELASEVISSEADGFPFYIHKIVLGLKIGNLNAEPESIRDLVAKHLVEANDPWELAHYRTRIPIYYPVKRDSELVFLVLDTLSSSDSYFTLDELLAVVSVHDKKYAEKQNLIELLRLMEMDHYICRNVDGNYQFLFPLIKRWWKLDRNI